MLQTLNCTPEERTLLQKIDKLLMSHLCHCDDCQDALRQQQVIMDTIRQRDEQQIHRQLQDKYITICFGDES